MDKFVKFNAVNIFLNNEKKELKSIDDSTENILEIEKSVVGPDFITMSEALAIAGGKDSSKIVDKNGLCSSFLLDPYKLKKKSKVENSCEFCMHSELIAQNLFFKPRYSCKIGKGPDYTSPQSFN